MNQLQRIVTLVGAVSKEDMQCIQVLTPKQLRWPHAPLGRICCGLFFAWLASNSV